MPPRQNPCENCRKQHVRYIKCIRCQKLKRECVRVEIKWRFRHTLSGPLQTDRSLKYIDETPRFTGVSHEDPPSQSPPAVSDSGISPHTPNFNLFDPGPISEVNQFSVEITLGGSSGTSSQLLDVHHHPLPRICTREACLLRYFVQDLARWFDLCDPDRSFANEIPRRGRECQILLNAVLAASARYFSTLPKERQGEILNEYGLEYDLKVNEEIVLYYHNKCIMDLRSLADDPDAFMDENLLATAVILRFYEELDTPFIELPTETAVKGLHVFIEAQASLALSSPGVRQAMFWIGFRQEFHVAFSQQRPFRLSLSSSQSYLSWTPAPDHVWVNRLLIIGARALQYCYDDRSDRGLARYQELVELHNQWLRCRPLSFSPIYFEDPNQERGELFPHIWYIEDCHILASQTLGFLRILLIAYSPHIPRFGISRRESMNIIDERLKNIVFEICGIGLSNRHSPPALLGACIAINICSDRFTDFREQQVLMEIVVNTTREANYWPSMASQANLKKVWGWES